ncbi:MAG: hypothetical protein ACD_58C00245G0001 [uncultured bacterium]|nr:MAG: hypothetical protein ACD_58C00245G0001 [uncultured bacterium]
MKINILSITNNLGRVIILLIILYILFNLGRSIFSNYQVNEKILNVNNEITDLANQNQMIKNQNLYYQTNTYKEIEARRKLDLKKEGETVVIVPENSDKTDTTDISDSTSSDHPSKKIAIIPNYVKWWNFLIGK